MAGPVLYRSLMSDNLRWYALELREGDIVISAPWKCGVTWTQRLISLLVFNGPQLPAPMSRVSPWLDQTIRPIEDVVRALDAQRHRRFIKTHTPLDGLVLDDRVTYIGVGRDPRDAAVSELFQWANVEASALRTPEVTAMPHQRFVQSGADFRLTFDCAPDRIEAFRSWMDAAAVPSSEMRFRPPTEIGSLAAILHHFGSLWQRRHLPNVAMFHFVDYQADLVGELIRLAEVLGIELGCARARKLAAYATLDAMRERAFDFAPNATDGVWRSNERFFRAGGRGEWRGVLCGGEEQGNGGRVAALAPPGLAAWAHGGRHARDPAVG